MYFGYQTVQNYQVQNIHKKSRKKKLIGFTIIFFIVGLYFFVNFNTIKAEKRKVEEFQDMLIAKERELQFREQEVKEKIEATFVQYDLISNEINRLQSELTQINDELKERTELLAKIIHLEQRGDDIEDLSGKVAVGLVVLNRVKDPSFPNTIEEVIFQKNQFQPTFDGSWDKHEPTELDFKAAELALADFVVKGEKGVSVNSALFFLNPKISDEKNLRWFRENLKYLDTIGEHEFYTYK